MRTLSTTAALCSRALARAVVSLVVPAITACNGGGTLDSGQGYGGGGTAEAALTEAQGSLAKRFEIALRDTFPKEKLCARCFRDTGRASCQRIEAADEKLIEEAVSFLVEEKTGLRDHLARPIQWKNDPYFSVTGKKLESRGRVVTGRVEYADRIPKRVEFNIDRVLSATPEQRRLTFLHEVGHLLPYHGEPSLFDDKAFKGKARDFTGEDVLDTAAACAETLSDVEEGSRFLVVVSEADRGAIVELAKSTREEVSRHFTQGTLGGIAAPSTDTGWMATLAPQTRESCFVSAVGYAKRPATLSQLSWLPRAPYGRDVPDLQGKESGYLQGNVDMAGNRVLLKFEENDLGIKVRNSAETDALLSCGKNVCPLVDGLGVHGNAGHITGGRSVALPDTKFDTFTLLSWVNLEPTTTCGYLFNSYYPAGEGTRGGLCFGADGTLSWNQWYRDGTALRAHGSRSVERGKWHHVAMRRDDNAKTLSIFIDGSLYREPDVYTGKTLDAAEKFGDNYLGKAGHFYSAYFYGLVDNFMLFDRSLSDAEIRNHFVRGATDVTIQVRAAEGSDPIEEAPWIGPDGTSGTYFSEAGRAVTGPPVFTIQPPLHGSRFQYQMCLKGDGAQASPQVLSVLLGLAP